RDSAGNPKQLLHRARLQGAASRRTSPPRAAAPSPPAPPVLQPVEVPPPAAWEGPVLGAVKPPLHVEEGMIEVGWDPEPAPGPTESDPAPVADPAPSAVESEEAIDDHYAALQAWNEWARNQGRSAPHDPADPSSVIAATGVETSAADADSESADAST